MKAKCEYPLTIAGLRRAYRSGVLTPVAVVEALYRRIEGETGKEAWTHLRPRQDVLADARQTAAAAGQDRPLAGVPFAVKDNIDVAGLPTTAACPAYAYVPDETAFAVSRLLAAGAILVGKTNLDQFATGLVGTRSPYGAVGNPFDARYMSGGSSSGSAAAVARGWVAFALGTDTAGSGRIPAGACNLVGAKPSPGLVSTHGVLPACRSLDCISVLAHTVEDAWMALSAMVGSDTRDPYSRVPEPIGPLTRDVRIGVPKEPEFFGDTLAADAYQRALDRVVSLPGVRLVPVDLAPLHAVAALLYEGPWVAERRAALGAFLADHGAEMDATVRAVIARADAMTAADAFRGQYALQALRPACEAAMAGVDLILVPTAPTIYTHEAIAADPIALNSRLGLYTNFVNLLGMAAFALPGPFRGDGLPAGITLIGRRGADHRLAELARRLEPRLHVRLGLGRSAPDYRTEPLEPLRCEAPTVEIAVVGAHLSGLPLNWQLVERGARLVARTRTSPDYRLYALPETMPPKPGLVRVGDAGAAVEVEVWSLPLREFGGFVAEVSAPLAIGTVTLAEGRSVKGFLCEAAAAADAGDITVFGGWRAYLASLEASAPTAPTPTLIQGDQ